MALTITPVKGASYTVSNKKCKVVDVTFDASYATGGLALTPANVNLKKIEFVAASEAKNAAGTSLVPVRFDFANNKLQAFRYDGASAGKAFLEETAAAVDLSTFTARLVIYGF